MAKAKRRNTSDEQTQKAGNGSARRRKVRLARLGLHWPRITWQGVLLNLVSLMVWIGIVAGLVAAAFSLDLPEIDHATLTRRPHIQVLDVGGWEVANFGDIYRASVDLKALPPHVPAAIISVEDRRFYSHPGVDLRGIARAVVTDIRAGARVQGGSTITQQVAKNVFLSPDRTMSRKIKEMLLAIKLEQTFTKDQILSLYMNRVYFGNGIYGYEAASERFFNRPAKDLTVFQAAVLAGQLKAPTHYNPTREPARAKARAQIVLGTMVDTGAITPAQQLQAMATADSALKAVPQPPTRGRYFADWVASQIDAYVGGTDRDLVVKTTLDGRLQMQAEESLEKHLTAQGAKLNVAQGAIVVLGTDGAVRAMVGGRDYDDSQFNRATQALRQPGSAFKPFVYLAGVEAGYRTDDMLTDAPLKIGKWRPQNFTGTYDGPVTVETAFAKSLNTAAVRLAQHVGIGSVINVAHRLGITEKLKSDLSVSLGSGEVTLLELTGAYTPFANGGQAVLPYAIESITARDGKALYIREGGGLGEVVSADALAAMNQMMSAVISKGTGTAAAFGYPAGGKTGTSSDFRDAWFMGFTADYVTGVWVGNDSGAGMKKVTGGGLPAQVWRDVMIAAHAGQDPRTFPGQEPVEKPDLIARFLESIIGK